MNKRFQNFLSLFATVGSLCSFAHYLSASGQGTNDAIDYCGTSHTFELPVNAYGDLPKGYQYFDVPGCGLCGYYAVFLSFETAINPSATNIELTGKRVMEQLGKFGSYIADLRKRERLPLEVYGAFEKLVWEVVFHAQKDAFDLTEDDWKNFFDALASGGVLLDVALLPFLAWWLCCDITVMHGDGQEKIYSGVFPEEEKIRREDSKKEEQHSEQEDRFLAPEKVLENAQKSKSIEKNDVTKDSKILEDSDTSESFESESFESESFESESFESESEEESEDAGESDESEEETKSPKCTIRVFYAQNGDKGHYWAVIPDYFQEIDEDKDLTGSARISLWHTAKKSCH